MIQVTRVTYLRGTLALGEEIYSTVGEPVRVEDALHTTDASKDLGGGTGWAWHPAFCITFSCVPCHVPIRSGVAVHFEFGAHSV